MHFERFNLDGHRFTFLNMERNNPGIALEPICFLGSYHPEFSNIFNEKYMEGTCFNELLHYTGLRNSDFASRLYEAARDTY
jgi:hypothetical protein